MNFRQLLSHIGSFLLSVKRLIAWIIARTCALFNTICSPLKFYSNASRGNNNSASLDTSNQTPTQVLTHPTVNNNTIKTSNQLKSKLYSLARRLSVRNFMDYCVIALNEASSSSSAYKFDFTTFQGSVWLLGVNYELPRDINLFIDDVRSKIWMTYRKNFPPIDENGHYTSDRGFGCMIRCGQMVLSNAIIYKNLGRDWRWSEMAVELNSDVYVKILNLFQDKESSVYSIHNIVKLGEQEGKLAGEWFGPNTIAQALKRLSNLQKSKDIRPESIISVETALDNIVFIDEVRDRFTRLDEQKGRMNSYSECKTSFDRQWIPGILFIQLRLGLTKINPIYFSALKKTFQFKNSLGIIGGRPNHALYLIGHVDDEIIYLDPHLTQLYVDLDEEPLSDKANEEVKHKSRDSTYHCTNPEKISIDKLDPSLALCFYFHREHDFDEWCKTSKNTLINSEQAPMFEIAETRPTDWLVSTSTTKSDSNEVRDERTKLKTRHDNEIFTVLKGPSSENPQELKDLSRDALQMSRTTNESAGDDEEFEMLG